MALSNWDIYAIDEESRATNAVFVAPSGVSVAIYKNWLYVRDEDAWTEKSYYTKPTIAEIQQGDLTYKDIHIRAWRGPKNGIYAFVWNGWAHEKNLKVMAGIGCYGFRGEEWVGIEESELQFLASKCPPVVDIPIPDYTSLKTEREREAAYNKALDAIEAQAMRDILQEESIRKLNLQFFGGKRFNQGDAYLVEKFDQSLGDIATAPGESKPPLIIQMLKPPAKET